MLVHTRSGEIGPLMRIPRVSTLRFVLGLFLHRAEGISLPPLQTAETRKYMYSGIMYKCTLRHNTYIVCPVFCVHVCICRCIAIGLGLGFSIELLIVCKKVFIFS